MSRQAIREMKRALEAAASPWADVTQKDLGRESALALLERSIGFGHTRLAVIRLSIAVHAGADVPREHWSYCEEVAQNSKDLRLQTLWIDAAEVASRRQATPNVHHALIMGTTDSVP